MSLNGVWHLKDSKGEFETDAVVPGDVFSTLVDKGLMPNPYIGRNELVFKRLEDRDWIYTKEFEISKEPDRAELVLEGVDTVSRIYLNGVLIGETQDMFMEYRFRIEDLLRIGKNTLRVEILSPKRVGEVLERNNGRLHVSFQSFRVYLRKGQYSFGWDWGPSLPSGGIWRGVRIEMRRDARIHGSTAYISDLNGTVHFTGYVEDMSEPEGYSVRLAVNGETIGKVEVKSLGSGRGIFEGDFDLDLDLWYPWNLGEPKLHDFEFVLIKDGEEIDKESKRIGLRKVEIEKEPDEEGESFIFRINGERVFVKGANWIPVDTLTGWMRDEDYERLIQMARESGMNMLRVWGGGIYENDRFYDLCDEKGIMVWQDFMFACAEYPDHLEWFRRLSNDEVRQNVIRLRHHPSIVLWCGNNENNWGFDEWNFNNKVDGVNLGNRLYLYDFPSICSKEDPSTPYWPSSPYGGEKANSERAGDVHVWHVWSGWEDFREYENVRGRFISEFGFQSAPDLETLRFMTEDDYILSEDMIHHNKQGEGIERILKYINSEFGLVFNIEDIVLLSQFIQAEAIKTGVEHWRSRKYRTSGVLYWQLNDVWPVFSWSAIDYFKRPKALYYYTKIFYSSVLPLISRGRIFVVNDLKRPIDGVLTIELWSSKGDLIWRGEVEVRVPKDGVLDLMEVPTESDIAHLVFEGGGIRVENHKIMKRMREMELVPSLEWKREGSEIHLRSRTPVLGVWIRGCKPSENFLNIFPDHERVVRCEGEAVRVTSLNDIEVKNAG